MTAYSDIQVLRKTFPGLREVSVAEEGQRVFDAFLGDLGEKLGSSDVDRNELCKSILADIYLGPQASQYEELLQADATSLAEKAHLLSFDPRCVTVEPEYYAELDEKKYYDRKPLLWLWKMFDLSPLGNNLHFGFEFRRLLASHVFKSCGTGVKLFTGIEVTYGYNITLGDNVTIHRNVLLDDRGEIIIHEGSSLSDYANVYSHSHDIVDPNDITLGKTEIGPMARITYHATVLSGVRVGPNTMVGAQALATRPVKPYHIHVGIPAKSVRVKPDAPPDVAGQSERKSEGGGHPTI